MPYGMVFIPGGQTLIGKDSIEDTFNHRHQSDSGSPFVAEVTPFFMDKYPVTVAQFRNFIQDTGFITEADRFDNADLQGF